MINDETPTTNIVTPESTARPQWMLPTPPRRDDANWLAQDIGDVSLRGLTLRLMRGRNLAQIEAAQLVHSLLNPAATDAQIAAALVSLAVKGETVEELAGMAQAMRARSVSIKSRHANFIDTAGTGSSRVKTFNVSTAAAFVIAGAGLPVAKHGSRAATSLSGSADVLEALGVNTVAAPEITENCLNEIGICFMFAPLYHGSTARVAHVRRELGVHTTFNLLGPLTNPANAPRQIIGVWHSSLVEPVARALHTLGIARAWVVYGSDGLDEVTLDGHTLVAEARNTAFDKDADKENLEDAHANGVHTFTLEPESFGFERQSLEKLRGGDAMANAEIIRAVLGKDASANTRLARNLVLANAAAALVVGGRAATPQLAAELAADSIKSGAARAKLDALVRETNR